MSGTVVLDGHSLDLDALVTVAREGAHVRIGEWGALDAGRAWLDAHLDCWRQGLHPGAIYGVTTGFGSFKNVHLGPDEVEAAQIALLRSHAVGVAVEPDAWFADEVVRGAALLRANTFLAGHSGVRRDIVLALVALLNAGVHPRVPQRGSVGASGDLCPLAHFALVLVGEGEASVGQGPDRRVVGGKAALEAAGIAPLALSYKEGLALVNGTTFSTACLALALHDAEALARTADVACALTVEALGAHGRPFDAKVHAVRGQAGQQDSARSLRALLTGSSRSGATDDRQDPYSVRCAPQVHGASRDALGHVRMVVDAELNAVTDNPLFFTRESDGEPWDLIASANPRRFGREPDAVAAYSAGNFHGEPVAMAADLLAIATAELGSIAERRLALLVDPRFSRGLPAHLAVRPGVQSGLMLAQYTAASLVSENKTLAHPASVDSIPTGNGVEDHVSMSTWAARKARTVVALTARVLALEVLAAAQANEWRVVRPDPTVIPPALTGAEEAAADARFVALGLDEVVRELAHGTAAAYRLVRSVSSRVVEDRPLAPDVEAVARLVESGGFVRVSGERAVGLRRHVALPADSPVPEGG